MVLIAHVVKRWLIDEWPLFASQAYFSNFLGSPKGSLNGLQAIFKGFGEERGFCSLALFARKSCFFEKERFSFWLTIQDLP